MESGFQFTNPSLIKFEFGINENYETKDNTEINVKINMNVKVNRLKEKNEAKVFLLVDIGDDNVESPFFIGAIETADFRWDNSISELMIDKLLNQNAPSLLLSYLRPVISQVTSASPFDAFNIPFMNFTLEE